MLTSHPALTEATQALNRAAAQAARDPLRPVYHFRPPAQWMNDPNGTIYVDGVYHLFYQLNPYADYWGDIHWGHATSRDLVHWEHRPIALWPSRELGEAHCFSGCAALRADGTPLLFYTSVGAGGEGQRPPFQQWAALGDATWDTWQKHPQNPILDLRSHDGPDFLGTWRDPFIFQAGGRTLMALGAETADEATVALYEAADGTLERWRFRGTLFRAPKESMRFCECPNFFPVGDAWVLLMSPYRPVTYHVGDFDAQTLRFTPTAEGVWDPGVGEHAPAGHFYATNLIFAPDGRRIVLGWVRGWEKGRGWNGCLALPRVVTLDAARRPRQAPIAELAQLRGREQRLHATRLPAGSHVVATGVSSCCEIAATIRADGAWSLCLRAADASEAALAITVDATGVQVDEVRVPFTQAVTEPVDVRVFVDRSVVEVFAAAGRVAVTLVRNLPQGWMEVDLVAQQAIQVEELAVWEMNPIW